jgi:starch synthase
MRVVQTVLGKAHHFHLARQLHQRGMLTAIFSSYPSWKLRNQHVPMDLVHVFPYVHMAYLASVRYGSTRSTLSRELAWWTARTLDGYVMSLLPECDVFVGHSAAGLKTGRLTQQRGGKYICDRGSSHIRWSAQTMTEEFARWGQELAGDYPKYITHEEQEYDQADLITVPSEFARRTYIEMGVPADKIKKVPYGSDMSRFAKVAEPALDSFDVLFVGQVSFRKGIPYLLEAFAKLRHPKKTLTIVGTVQPEINRYLQGKSFEDVKFVGARPHVRLKELMSRSHVMVLPSLEEGLALVQGEAMACGCPIIGSENTGGEDLFDDGYEGFIVPIRDSDAITERLERLAQDPALRNEMSARGLERVARIGGWETYGRDYVAVLETVTTPAARREASV